MQISKIIGTIIVGLVLFLVTFGVLTKVIADWRYKDAGKVAISGANIPDNFPVLVLTRGSRTAEYHAKILDHVDLEAYLLEHPDYTFLIPAGEEKRLNSELEQNSRISKTPINLDLTSPDPWQASLKMSSVSYTRQALEVSYTKDDRKINKSWYDATSKEIFPQYHQHYFYTDVIRPAAALAFPATFFLWAIIFLDIYLLRQAQKNENDPQWN